MLAGIFPTRPDRRYILLYQAFYIWRSFSMMQLQEIMAGIIGNRIIHLIDIFPLFRVEIYGTDHMLQFTERCFNPPPAPIGVFHFIDGKGRSGKIRNDILIGVI